MAKRFPGRAALAAALSLGSAAVLALAGDDPKQDAGRIRDALTKSADIAYLADCREGANRIEV